MKEFFENLLKDEDGVRFTTKEIIITNVVAVATIAAMFIVSTIL